jgi:ribonuclease P protein component
VTGAPASGGQKLPRARRITGDAEIRSLIRRGKRSRTAHLDVFASASPSSYARAGVIVPRYRRPVVERNLVKRRLREVLRREVLPRLGVAGLGMDVLVRARREAYGTGYAVLRDELVRWTEEQCSRAPHFS